MPISNYPPNDPGSAAHDPMCDPYSEAAMNANPLADGSGANEFQNIIQRLETQHKWLANIGEHLNEKVTRLIGNRNTTPKGEGSSATIKDAVTGRDNSLISEINARLMMNDDMLQRINDTINRLDGVL